MILTGSLKSSLRGRLQATSLRFPRKRQMHALTRTRAQPHARTPNHTYARKRNHVRSHSCHAFLPRTFIEKRGCERLIWLRLALRQVLFYSLACTICSRHRRRSETRVVLDICRRISACSFASLAARFRRRTGRAAGASEERRRSWERYGRVLPLPPWLDSASAIEDSIVKLRRYLVRNGQLRSWGTQRDLLVHETACLCIELVAYHSVVAYHHRQLRSSSTLFPALAAAPRGWHMSVESKRRAGPGCLVHHNTLGLHVCVCARARERMRV